MQYIMRLLMDSDCLIKLAKSSLKELVCRSFTVVIPPLVRKEVVDEGSGRPDAELVRENLEKKLLSQSAGRERSVSRGEEAVFTVFQSGHYDAICSDDRKFIKRLRVFHVPYLTPAVLIAVLVRNGKLVLSEALDKLDSLAPMISDEEYGTVKLFLDGWRNQ
jgi:rRNA-processing protein FCF1